MIKLKKKKNISYPIIRKINEKKWKEKKRLNCHYFSNIRTQFRLLVNSLC